MKKDKKLFCTCLAFLFLFSGCSVNGTFKKVDVSSSSFPYALSDGVSPPMSSEPAMERVFRFTNQTTDMTFDFSTQLCAPGESVILAEPQNGFRYTFLDIEREQPLLDVAMFTSGNVEIVAANDDEKGYSLTVFDDESIGEPAMQYMLIPQGLYWMRCEMDQKLYMGDIPKQPIEELLEIYPEAVLMPQFSNGNRDFTQMLWCYQPLYNLKIGSTTILEVTDDSECLFAYVDWDALESTDIVPNAPLFTNIISVGSMWCLAVQFEDERGKEYIYIAWENGMGGEAPGLMLHPINGRILTLEETKTMEAARQ